MSQMTPERPQQGDGGEEQYPPIKYGDVFAVSGELASQPIAPVVASMMQSAEQQTTGKTQKGGPAATMQSAAARNEQAGVLGHDDASDIPAEQGVEVTQTELSGGTRVVTESVAGQVVAQYMAPSPGPVAVAVTAASPVGDVDRDDSITIGEALEATTLTAGNKPVTASDAAAIQAAEACVIGGNVAAEAHAAAAANERVTRKEDKATLSDVLSDATMKLPRDKAATMEDAERVVGAEMRNSPAMTASPGGVAASVVAAARLNENRQAQTN